MAERHFDLIVIGGGPGGYVGAIRAAQLGMKVACIERDKLGGVCLNWGCIPTKALLANAELYEKVHTQAADWGLKVDGTISVDWSKTIGRSRDVASKLNKGIEFLFRKNKIESIKGNAKIVSARQGSSPCRVEVYDCKVQDTLTHAPCENTSKAPREIVTADHVLIATGSVARDLPFAKFDGDRIMGAREAMNTREMPASLIVIGAGAIGMEFAYFYSTFGTKVTVVEMMPRILPVEDDEISAALEKIYRKHGMDIRVSTTTIGVEKLAGGVKVTVAPVVKAADGRMAGDESKKEVLQADKVLLAVGVKGRYDGLFDASLGLLIEKDHVKTDFVPGKTRDEPIDYKTNLPGIHAIGDVIGPPWLAHVASEEAVVCVERLAHKAGKLHHDPIPIDYSTVPGCTYCHPQVASVGFTERDLIAQGKVKGKDYATGVYQLQAHGKAIASNQNIGMVKILRGLPRGEILGAHILGDQATELIGEMGLARRLEATTEELIVTMHAHPTMHEALHEAALASEGRVIHA
ncbi:MAG: dihydrolipoyl dehydrogenase [Phycisphaeraceae bacterium]|nr:dihydrolipoyl dehydrogenase [Phycisphaerae bacterium]MBX3392630.1 dihydrolipoyl dehydrogenase [Phycisphaeraceae bacterium]